MATNGTELEAACVRADAGLGLVLRSPMLKERIIRMNEAKRRTLPKAPELQKRR